MHLQILMPKSPWDKQAVVGQKVRPWDQKSLEQKVLGTKVHGKKSLGQKVHGTKSPWDKKSVGQKVIGQKSMRKKSQEKIPAKNSAKLSNETFL